jgi:hypothetical protein
MFGCGHYRMIWPARELQKQGKPAKIKPPGQREIELHMDGHRVTKAPKPDCDVLVLQRVTHEYLAQAIPMWRAQGLAVVVDVDDDLTSMHPANPAFRFMHPDPNKRVRFKGADNRHSWRNLQFACRHATLVTASTPALLERFAPHGRGVLLPNHLTEDHLGAYSGGDGHFGWPASIHSHPNDPSAAGNAVKRLVNAGYPFRVIGEPTGVGKAFSLDADPPGLDKSCTPQEWPRLIEKLTVGIAPLADTVFNAAKSWLKPLELSGAGVPWVASPRADYKRLHKRGCGMLADKPADWYRQVKRLMDSEQMRVDLAGKGLEVARSLLYSDHSGLWWEAWQQALRIQRKASRASTVIAG